MSEIGENDDLGEILKGQKRVYVLFYASWCPYSQKFLPIFQKYSSQATKRCIKVMIDDRGSLCDEYSIEIFPTVILFEDGKVLKRLDGEPRKGLSENQLKKLMGKD
jgi:thioredoxin 1